jgi:hypothetical protein
MYEFAFSNSFRGGDQCTLRAISEVKQRLSVMGWATENVLPQASPVGSLHLQSHPKIRIGPA